VTQRRISTILQVMDMLQDQKINSFSLVGLRGKIFYKKKRKWLKWLMRRRWRQKKWKVRSKKIMQK
jgi:hypothetical protein